MDLPWLLYGDAADEPTENSTPDLFRRQVAVLNPVGRAEITAIIAGSTNFSSIGVVESPGRERIGNDDRRVSGRS